MLEKLKISRHEHTGRLRPHEHTSYLPLAILLLVVGLLLAVFTVSSVFAADPPPQAGSIGLTGSVPSNPPQTPATITSPSNGSHFKTSPVTVTGTCQKGTLVEVYKNFIFAGSTICTNANTFSVDIDLLFGSNSLTAQLFDANNQAGPMSSAVTIFYDSVLPSGSPLFPLAISSQMVLNTDAVFRGTFPGQLLNVPITIIGGVPPYAVNVEWGDTKNKLIPRSDNLTFNAGHTYQKPGVFQITLQATDSQQRVAFLTVVAIVNGQPAGAASTTPKIPASKVLVLWPLFAIAATMVVSFWLGERREKHILAAASAAAKPLLGFTPPVHQ